MSKERRLKWKQEKQRRRQELKERYKYAPWYIRIPRLYLVKPLVALLVIAAVGYVLVQVGVGLGFKFLNENKNNPVDKEEILALSPIDEEGAKRIDAAAPVGKDDTWTICVYLVGSNLEDMDENDLSLAVQAQLKETLENKAKEADQKTTERLKTFTGELESNDLEMPAYLYYPVKPVKSEGEEEEDSSDIDVGAASKDIGEMTAETWPDNIRIVIQPGGATRWSNSAINPNRTQRFVYEKGEFKQVYDEPLEQASSPETLASFLGFCKERYPADHNMLVLWNHGGAAFGYGHDSIYNDMMSLKDVRSALASVYEPNADSPAFDIIGYDACLMSSLEVAHSLYGFASYYAVSEETEPGDGWDYIPWLKAMADDPTMSPAKIAQHIADSYMDYYMTQNVNMGWLMTNTVTFSVLDAKKSEELYNAYCELAKKQLVDATEDNSVMAEIGRCSNQSLHYASSHYNIYNTIDLGNYVDNMAQAYPEDCAQIKDLIGESVLYHRESGFLQGSDGISVYMPGSVESYPGLMKCLEYIYEVCEDPATRALYYYKIAGCLNDDMKAYLATLTDKEMPVIDVDLFKAFAQADPKITDTGFTIPVAEELQGMIQNHTVETTFYDEEEGRVRNYGKNVQASLDGQGGLNCEFDGTWICFDGVPLATEVVSSSDKGVEYRSRVLYKGDDAYLSFSWDKEKEEFAINGIKGASDDELAGGIINQLYDLDPYNYLINTRMNKELKPGDSITPIYETYYVDPEKQKDKEDDESAKKGDSIKVKDNSVIKVEKLADGKYITAAVVSDFRGDVYYSRVISNDVSGGAVTNRETTWQFVGNAY